MIDTDRLEDIQCDLGCVAAAMVAACHDVSGKAPCSRTSRDVSEAAMDDAVEAIFVERNERIDEANDTD